MPLLEPELSTRVVDAFYVVRRELGPGYLESVYREAMIVVLEELGVACVRECPLRVVFHGRDIGFFRGDILVEGRVRLELKATTRTDPAHEAQLLNALRVSGVRVGYLMNFGPRGSFKRYVLCAAGSHDETRRGHDDGDLLRVSSCPRRGRREMRILGWRRRVIR